MTINIDYFFEGVKETSNFVVYTPDKPDLWKAYQFCAERQLVFHLQRASAGKIKCGDQIQPCQTSRFPKVSDISVKSAISNKSYAFIM